MVSILNGLNGANINHHNNSTNSNNNHHSNDLAASPPPTLRIESPFLLLECNFLIKIVATSR